MMMIPFLLSPLSIPFLSVLRLVLSFSQLCAKKDSLERRAYLLPALVLAQRHDKLAAFSAGVFIVLVTILVRAKTVPIHFDTLLKRAVEACRTDSVRNMKSSKTWEKQEEEEEERKGRGEREPCVARKTTSFPIFLAPILSLP
jgi:membrane protein insertase Oxa1/YidC/SpoIIIJ